VLTATFIVAITLIGYILSLTKGPVWGLIAYANLYFNNPNPDINWWGEYVPDLRWSLLSVGVILLSMIIHRKTLSKHKLGVVYFVFVLYIIAELLTNTDAVNPAEAKTYSYYILTYCVISYLIVKTLATFDDLRLFILIVIVLGAFLGIQGVLEGKFMDGRLNNIGPADAHGSNELGVLLGSIIAFTLPFVVRGKMHERIICLLSLPFIINGFTLTVSRGAFLALVLSSFYAFLFVADKKIKKYMLVVSICVMPMFFYFIDESYTDRISSLWKADRSTETAVDELSSGRIFIWKYGFRMVSDYPLGAGPGGFKELARFYMPKEILVFHPDAEYGVRAAHNTYLLVMVELGYLGIGILTIICLGTLYVLVRSSQKLRKIGKRGTLIDLFTVALSISFFCILFGGLTGSKFYYEFFWWHVALAAVVRSLVLDMEQTYLQDKVIQTTYLAAACE